MNVDWSRTVFACQPLGISARSSSNLSLTPSTTAIVLVPDCLRTSRTTAGWPLTVATDCSSSMPSSTRATSRTRTE